MIAQPGAAIALPAAAATAADPKPKKPAGGALHQRQLPLAKQILARTAKRTIAVGGARQPRGGKGKTSYWVRDQYTSGTRLLTGGGQEECLNCNHCSASMSVKNITRAQDHLLKPGVCKGDPKVLNSRGFLFSEQAQMLQHIPIVAAAMAVVVCCQDLGGGPCQPASRRAL